MRIFGISTWTIVLVLAAMYVQSKYNLIQRIPVLKSL